LRDGRPRASIQEGANDPLRLTTSGGRKRSFLIETSRAFGSSYQGMPLRSGAFDDCSGRPPAMCISAMSRTPAKPPPIKAATTHHNETICRPRFSWSREWPGTDAAPWLRFSIHPIIPGPDIVVIDIRQAHKKIRLSPDGFQPASPYRPTGTKYRPSSTDFEAGRAGRVLPHLEPYGLRL
jgi:hypothetical protein